MNLMKNEQCIYEIQPTNMNRSGITLLPLWECLLSMKGEKLCHQSTEHILSIIRIFSISNTNSSPKFNFLGQTVQKLENCHKWQRAITLSKIRKLKFKITCISSDHDETFSKVSGQFDKRWGRSCGDKVWVSKGHNCVKNGRNKNQKPHAHLHMIRRQSIKFQISPMKDVRRVVGTRSDGR